MIRKPTSRLSKQAGGRRSEGNAKVLVGESGDDASSGCALKKADLEKIGLVHVLNGIDFFAQNGSDRVYANRTAIESLDDRAKQLAIDFVEALGIDIHQLQCVVRDFRRDASVSLDLRVVANPLEQPVRDAWRSPATLRDFRTAFRSDGRAEDL